MIRPRITAAGIVLLLASASLHLHAQSMDDLNIQIHGYATQGFLYTNHNSWNGSDSENGSAAWSEAVVNLSAQPDSKLRIGVQARYFLLGNYGDQITLDWAQADYRANQYFGVRVGKVKTPTGLWNETQDIDPAHLWALLPQSVYPIASRDSLLNHFGAVVYGAIPLGDRSKIEYRGYGGTRIISGNDSVFQPLRDEGMSAPNGIHGPVGGAALHWQTPLSGLMFGASMDVENLSGELLYAPLSGKIDSVPSVNPSYFGKYEHGRIMFAGEYDRAPVRSTIQFTGLPAIPDPIDYRAFYFMASYKLSAKLTAGAYYSSFINRSQPVSNARFQKDWTVSARYDFNSFLYIKAEQHFMDGTALGFSLSENQDLQPTTRMTILKLGVSF